MHLTIDALVASTDDPARRCYICEKEHHIPTTRTFECDKCEQPICVEDLALVDSVASWAPPGGPPLPQHGGGGGKAATVVSGTCGGCTKPWEDMFEKPVPCVVCGSEVCSQCNDAWIEAWKSAYDPMGTTFVTQQHVFWPFRGSASAVGCYNCFKRSDVDQRVENAGFILWKQVLLTVLAEHNIDPSSLVQTNPTPVMPDMACTINSNTAALILRDATPISEDARERMAFAHAVRLAWDVAGKVSNNVFLGQSGRMQIAALTGALLSFNAAMDSLERVECKIAMSQCDEFVFQTEQCPAVIEHLSIETCKAVNNKNHRAHLGPCRVVGCVSDVEEYPVRTCPLCRTPVCFAHRTSMPAFWSMYWHRNYEKSMRCIDRAVWYTPHADEIPVVQERPYTCEWYEYGCVMCPQRAFNTDVTIFYNIWSSTFKAFIGSVQEFDRDQNLKCDTVYIPPGTNVTELHFDILVRYLNLLTFKRADGFREMDIIFSDISGRSLLPALTEVVNYAYRYGVIRDKGDPHRSILAAREDDAENMRVAWAAVLSSTVYLDEYDPTLLSSDNGRLCESCGSICVDGTPREPVRCLLCRKSVTNAPTIVCRECTDPWMRIWFYLSRTRVCEWGVEGVDLDYTNIGCEGCKRCITQMDDYAPIYLLWKMVISIFMKGSITEGPLSSQPRPDWRKPISTPLNDGLHENAIELIFCDSFPGESSNFVTEAYLFQYAVSRIFCFYSTQAERDQIIVLANAVNASHVVSSKMWPHQDYFLSPLMNGLNATHYKIDQLETSPRTGTVLLEHTLWPVNPPDFGPLIPPQTLALDDIVGSLGSALPQTAERERFTALDTHIQDAVKRTYDLHAHRVGGKHAALRQELFTHRGLMSSDDPDLTVTEHAFKTGDAPPPALRKSTPMDLLMAREEYDEARENSKEAIDAEASGYKGTNECTFCRGAFYIGTTEVHPSKSVVLHSGKPQKQLEITTIPSVPSMQHLTHLHPTTRIGFLCNCTFVDGPARTVPRYESDMDVNGRPIRLIKCMFHYGCLLRDYQVKVTQHVQYVGFKCPYCQMYFTDRTQAARALRLRL
jgi:hypothetical protein